MKTKRYYANMSVNNGTHFSPDWEGSSYKKLAKDISHAARANCYVGSEYIWKVWDEDDVIVAAGAGRKTDKGFSFYNCSDLISTLI